MKKSFSFFAVCTVLLMLCSVLSACGEVPPEESAESVQTSVTQTLVPEEEPAEPEQAIASCELFCNGHSIFYIDPTDRLIKVLNTSSGAIRALSQRPVYGQFIVDGSVIWFCDAAEERIVSLDILKGVETVHFSLPMSRGIKLGNKLYFVDDGVWGKEMALYCYDVERGFWENRRLAGCVCTPNRVTAVFGDECLWFVSDGEESTVCALYYDGFTFERIFTSESKDGVFELSVRDWELFFADPGKNVYTVPRGSNTPVEYISGALRLYSLSDESIYYQKTYGYPSKLYLGNDRGRSVDVKGGIIISSFGNRSLIRRSIDGQECLVMVKYPEDTVVYSRECSVFDTVTNGRFVLVFMNESRYLYFFDLETGTEDYFDIPRIEREGVSLEEYYADTTGLCCPSVVALANATEREVVDILCAALAKNDRYTLGLILQEGDSILPFGGFVPRDVKIEKIGSGENSVRYGLIYGYYAPGDSVTMQFLPEFIRKGRITLVMEGRFWKVDVNAS